MKKLLFASIVALALLIVGANTAEAAFSCAPNRNPMYDGQFMSGNYFFTASGGPYGDVNNATINGKTTFFDWYMPGAESSLVVGNPATTYYSSAGTYPIQVTTYQVDTATQQRVPGSEVTATCSVTIINKPANICTLIDGLCASGCQTAVPPDPDCVQPPAGGVPTQLNASLYVRPLGSGVWSTSAVVPYGTVVDLQWSTNGSTCMGGYTNSQNTGITGHEGSFSGVGGAVFTPLSAEAWQDAKTAAPVSRGFRSTGLSTSTMPNIACSGHGSTLFPGVSVTVQPQCLSGTVSVTSNVPTTWSLTGPSGTTNQTASSSGITYASQASGAYTLSNVPTLTGYGAPVITPVSSQSLACGGALAFAITYTAAPPIPDVPSVDLTASPTSVDSGSAALLSWNTAGIRSNSCVASVGWAGSKPDKGQQSTGSLTVDTSYTLTCNRADGRGTVADSVTVTVNPPAGNPPGGGTPPQCSDGVDNGDPEDVLVDMADPDCEDPLDNNETFIPSPGDDDDGGVNACNDGFDNDGDGLIDQADGGCANGDTSEQSTPDIREI